MDIRVEPLSEETERRVMAEMTRIEATEAEAARAREPAGHTAGAEPGDSSYVHLSEGLRKGLTRISEIAGNKDVHTSFTAHAGCLENPTHD